MRVPRSCCFLRISTRSLSSPIGSSSCARVRSSTRPPAPAATRERSAAIWWGGGEKRPSLAIHLFHKGGRVNGQTRSVTFFKRARAPPPPPTGGTPPHLTQPPPRKISFL